MRLMKRILLVAMFSLGLFVSFLYGIDQESIMRNYGELSPEGSSQRILDLNDFEFVKDHHGFLGNPTSREKSLYKSKETGRLWMVGKDFDLITARHYSELT